MRNSILFLFFLLAIVSCESKKIEINPKVDSYPMAVGTEWTYDREIIIKKYESESSDKIIDTDIYNFTVKVWIDKDTLLKDTMNVMIFKTQENNNWTLKEFKFIDNEGLKTYAYTISGNTDILPKKKVTSKSSYILYFNWLLNNEINIYDEIIFEEQPVLDIKLPLYNNSSWTYRHPSGTNTFFYIDKEVIGTERLNLIGENFDCFKVYWNYLNNTVSNEINITDWISDKGLIKRIIFSDRITLRTEFGEYSDEIAQVTETLIIKGLKI